MTTLLVGFDSAWTATNTGALVGVLHRGDGTWLELAPPVPAGFAEATRLIGEWQAAHRPQSTVVVIDQPTIVRNNEGMRPVENLLGSTMSLRHGGIQPSNRRRVGIFDREAPLWPFLERFGGAMDPVGPSASSGVYETSPALAMIALGWTLPDDRPAGRLPKYNPARKKAFSPDDWRHLCSCASTALRDAGLAELPRWLAGIGEGVAAGRHPEAGERDGIDAAICLLVALQLAAGKECLGVGDGRSGRIVIPAAQSLQDELETRCRHAQADPALWVRRFHWGSAAIASAPPAV